MLNNILGFIHFERPNLQTFGSLNLALETKHNINANINNFNGNQSNNFRS